VQGRGWIRTLARSVAVLVGALALAQPVAAAPALDYFALGDSVASGHGLLDKGGTCRRSPRAYPQQLVPELRERHDRVRFTMLACSGATAAGSGTGLRVFSRQVSAVLAKPTTRRTLVSITIGINDFAWSDIVATYFRLRDPDEASFDGWVDSTAERVAASLGKQLRRLLSRSKIAVVLTEYPNPANTDSLLFGGPMPCSDKAACYGRTEQVVHELNAVLDGLARKRVRIAAIHEAFHGHEAPSPSCGGDPPAVADTWFQYPDDPESNSFPPVAAFVGEVWRGDCFHPNERGAAEIAAAVDAAGRGLGR
jgi:lysophospholipase L1-like esterase